MIISLWDQVCLVLYLHESWQKRKKCLVIEKWKHIGGNIYCEEMEGIQVHRYGAHIFHTSDKNMGIYESV